MSADAARRVGRSTAVNWTAWILARALTLATLLLLVRSAGRATSSVRCSPRWPPACWARPLATGGLADATARQAASAEGAGPASAAAT